MSIGCEMDRKNNAKMSIRAIVLIAFESRYFIVKLNNDKIA